MSSAELNLLCNLVEQVGRLADEVKHLADEQEKTNNAVDVLSDCVVNNKNGFSAIMTATVNDLY